MATVSAPAITPTPSPTLIKDNVQVAKASQTTEYEKSLQIVLGTVFGVFGFLGILIIGTLVYRFCKNRLYSNRSGGFHRNPSLHRSVSIDLEQKQVPTVLLLYSYDCSAHEKVVEALAGFLIETCNCNVHVDIFEEQIIYERGLDEWLVDNLQEAEFIIVLTSLGARLRCCKKKVRFKMDPERTLPDYFAVAVDYVAEKMRVERSKGMSLTTFCVAYMDYSTESDIPPPLEMAYRFCLMKDITALFCHLHGIHDEPTKNGIPIVGITADTFHTSEMGQELKVAIESIKEYFKANPDWVESRMELMPNPGKLKSHHVRKSSHEPLIQRDISLPKDNIQMMNNDIRKQVFPDLPKHSQQTPMIPLPNIQTSFQSSCNIHPSLSSPLHKSSKSCEHLKSGSTSNCDLGVIETSNDESPDLKVKQFLTAQEMGLNGDIRSKSKSMPAVNRNSLYSSQTIFQAEVHKAWDQYSRNSDSDSQETHSDHDSVIDDLELDLNSIINPPQTVKAQFSNMCVFDNHSELFSLSRLPAKFEDISEIFNKKASISSNPSRDTSRVCSNLNVASDDLICKRETGDHIRIHEFRL